ncbi:nitroreductase family deazaflavin-dependent oxidoreductase [Agromyces sp. CFH 90414]|uniref:Nitroreductase family deazaflavin-dependent oxidoreductase n=1 Tax=Agromyces agglutinans TaxID=2662258 RepID=A0A6I2F8W5_9MICO|nr:nitroreductase/quinone reductase family protein [Agromyces agglutinans]MRG60217.1 nitroreductase family deazaflavin-dependent oxidoreductase [Agromyces agglutinans]
MGADGGVVGDRTLAFLAGLHRLVIRVTGGRLGWRLGRLEVVELHTRGRRSGERRSAMLTAPIVDDDRIVLVASKGGADRHPAWYLNLVADPRVELTTRTGLRPMIARTADADERAALWPRVVRSYAGYRRYQERTARVIPVVICEPAT